MSLTLIIGCMGFILFLVYDINSFTLKNTFLGSSFFIGSLLVLLSTVQEIYLSFKAGAFSGTVDTVLVTIALLWFLALVYTLFFALPFQDTYTGTDSQQKVCDTGVYALCRHPGVICFSFTYLFLSLAALPAALWISGTVFSVLNILYVVFQDAVTFKKTFPDYGEYQKKVPFLIPTKNSCFRAIRTFGRKDRKDDSK